MRLDRARVQKYRSIRDTGEFEVEINKTILVGPNEAGKTALLQAIQQLHAPTGVSKFDALRDYPRSEFNDVDSGRVTPASQAIVTGHFVLEDDDKAAVSAIDARFDNCSYVFVVNLDNSRTHFLEDSPERPRVKDIRNDLLRLEATGGSKSTASPTLKEQLDSTLAAQSDPLQISDELATKLRLWLDLVLPLIDETNVTELDRHAKVVGTIELVKNHLLVLDLLNKRLPVFVYFNNYFRVHPIIHLDHLATRIESNVLDDDLYDFGNQCLMKLLGFTARDLSNLGKAIEPPPGDAAAFATYRNQLDSRSYKLNAAEVRLTKQIKDVWKPDGKDGEEFKVRIRADGQYLRVVVEDELGVEIELNQRSEGFQWLVSFFVVFFAETQDKYKNAILLLDEPGLNLHALKQRDFRETLSKLALDNQLLFSTHSPFLVGPDELDLVRVVEMVDRTTGTKVHTSITASDPAALLPLQEALGYNLAQSLFMQKKNLVLEGLTDYWYLEATSELLRDSGDAQLNESIALVPADGAGKVVYYATILHAQELKVAALLDSDTSGDTAANQEVLVHTLGSKRILRTKDAYVGPVTRPEIEDLLRETLLVVARDDLGWDGVALATSQPNRPVAEVIADVAGANFSKYRLAKAYLRWTRAHAASELMVDERTAWTTLIKKVNAALS